MPIFTTTNSFKGQRENETTVAVIRKHWITLLGPALITLFLVSLPFVAYSFIADMAWYPVFSDLYWFLIGLYFLVVWNLFFYNIMLYFLNTMIVTNIRVIGNEQKGLFANTINEFERDKIQNVSVKINGLLASLLDYGDVDVQTAGTEGSFHFSSLPCPKKVQDIITGHN